jgi:hypothetical protein
MAGGADDDGFHGELSIRARDQILPISALNDFIRWQSAISFGSCEIRIV